MDQVKIIVTDGSKEQWVVLVLQTEQFGRCHYLKSFDFGVVCSFQMFDFGNGGLRNLPFKIRTVQETQSIIDTNLLDLINVEDLICFQKVKIKVVGKSVVLGAQLLGYLLFFLSIVA